jgi:transcriptional regulator of arginine metabolism
MPKTREEQQRRRKEILRILASDVRIESLDDLLDQLGARGFQITKSSVCRDLQDLGITRVSGRYQLPFVDEEDAALQRASRLIREVVPSGPFVTVIQCSPGAGRAVAAILKSLAWDEVAGVVADDDTAVAGTAHTHDQKLLLGKLRKILDPERERVGR